MTPKRDNRERRPDRDAAENRVPTEEPEQPDLATEEPDEYQLVKILADEAVDELEVIIFDEDEDEDPFVVGADDDAVIEQMEQYIEDDEVLDDFAERQRLNIGSKQLLLKLHQNTAESPELTAGDVDAAWDDSDVGDETVGGTAPTPDQDIVDELGKAVGLTYEDDEPLGIQDKIEERERHRWELDPASADDDDELDELDEDELDALEDDDLDELDDLDDDDLDELDEDELDEYES